jgi:UDP-GlcNAc:undecaprenyl-phosphate GlcNAc-1-phosphate transferase
MSLANILSLSLLFLFPINLGALKDNVALLFIGGICAFLLAYLFTFGVRVLSSKMGWFDRAEPGRIEKKKISRLGGIAIFLAFVVASLLFYVPGAYQVAGPLRPEQNSETTMYWLFLAAAVLIVLVHGYDDLKPLKPLVKLAAQTLGVIILLGPFGNRFNGVLVFGFSNPFAHMGLPWYRESVITLFIHTPDITFAAIPAVLFTWFWMVGMMNTVNLIDGVDGLATGVVAITAICITITSWVLQQYSIAILSAIFTGAVLGFLPHNWNPAKIIMGDSGAHFLGLGLAVLSVIGGAKVGVALMVLGIPILDLAVVAVNRIRRGQSPLHYDTTHLHYRLRATGWNARQICYLFYGLTAVFGILSLNLLRIYKLMGIGLVVLTMIVLIAWIDYRQRKRGAPVSPPPAPDPTGDVREPAPAQDTDEVGGSSTTPPRPGSTSEHVRARLPL